MTIGKFSVNNSVLVNILMAALLIFGYLSLSRLPQEQFSEVPFYWVNIIVPYPGVSGEDVERTITVKIENQYKGISKLKRIQSVSSEGLSVVRIEFDDGISKEEFERLYQEVQTRFNKVELPEGTLEAEIDDFSAADFLPVIEVIVSGEAEYKVINSTAIKLKDRILGIKQVSTADLVGSRENQLLIKVKKEKMESLRISFDEILRAVESSNITVPGGVVNTKNREYLIRTISEASDIEDFLSIVVRRSSKESDSSVYLRDLAEISIDYDTKGVYARFNGKEAVTIRVAKVTGGSSTGVINQVKSLVQDFSEILPQGVSISLFNDSTIQIRDSINVLISNAIMGFILLLLILLVFIGVRNAVITAIGIPVTFAITFIILEFLGETFNSNTLFGLVLVLGLIVDDAIVIVENSFRLQNSGLGRRQAAIKGSNQVIVPVIASTLTTVAAFLPLMILPGTIGKFLRVIPLTVIIALLASTFEAAFFLPSHFADWPGKGKVKDLKFFDSFQIWFRKIITRLYKIKSLVVVFLIVIIIVSFAVIPFIQQDLFSAEDFTLFYIDIELPLGANREQTNQVVSMFESRITPLIGKGEIVAVNSYIGFSSGQNQNTLKGNVAQITVDLSEINEGRKRPITRIMAEIRELCDDISGTENVSYTKAANGPPTSAPLAFRLTGNSYEDLRTATTAIEERLKAYPELFNIKNSLEKGTPEIRIRVNEELASIYGLNAAIIGNQVRAVFDGLNAGTIFQDNEQIDIIIAYDFKNEATLDMIEQLKFINPAGKEIPFSSVCTLSQEDGLASIRRVDGKREVTIESEAYSNKNIRQINNEIKEYYDKVFKPVYPDMVLKLGGEFSEFADLIIQILRIFLIGLFLIYLILATQFKSYSQPFLILFSIPLAFAGVIFFLIVSGTPFSTTVLYSGVALAGIAVNDAIVLISFINKKRKEGTEIEEAVTESAITRLRPILLTSITTIAGLIPTAIGLGGQSVVWGPMASTIIFGLLFSTISTLVFVPCFYGLIYDKKNRKKEIK
ncbi:MAG: efflux RND transporter permease subunit [Spirochaetales bacterium]|nr:efflux RND transporter permease subunit [Spirochaetales bacterium]